ncbi:hypothetical protein D3C79_777410 [compost metagenome]
MASMYSALPHTPASGKPPAMDLAKVVRSGATPICSMAKKVPVRPAPVCTSSAISRMPCWSHRARRRFISSFGAGRKPPSPCTGSRMIAAMSRGSASFLKMRSTEAMASSTLIPCSSLGNRARKMPPGIRPMPAEYGTTLPVRPRVIMVRPW